MPTRRIVRVSCHASSPRRAGERCNNVLGDVPGPLRYVGLTARRPEQPDGRVWLQCGRIDCRTWNVFVCDVAPDPAGHAQPA